MRKLLPALLLPVLAWGQQETTTPDFGELHGNFQFDGQYYVRDPQIDSTGEFYPDERFLANGFANINYVRGNFRAGIRYENYQNVLLGFPPNFKGEGITFRYAQFVKDGLDITVGNFYEQFGSGMILRAYEERGLGLDNNIDGIRLKYSPTKGIHLKGLIGRQRWYFDKGEGIVRGADAEFHLNNLVGFMADSKTQLTLGGSFVSRYQAANHPTLNLPENVGAGGLRFGLIRGGFGLNAEYTYKVNDPSADNGYIYRPGQGLLVNLSYARKGFGMLLSAKRIDNMSFRSDRNAGQIDLFVNFLPPTTKQHTYALPSLYSYATQINGETSLQAEFTFAVKRGSPVGGKYGMNVSFNYSSAYSLLKDSLDAFTPIGEQGTDGYRSDWFSLGPVKFFQDINVEVKKKLSSKHSLMLTYYNFEYNQSVLGSATIAGGLSDVDLTLNPSAEKMAYVNAFVLEWQWKLKSKHSLRTELQGLFSEQDRGNIAMLLLEYTIAPSWFVAIQDVYNYGNPDPEQRLHFPLVSGGYTVGTTRFQLNYGRQQRGVFCVGGICRVVPPSNGFTLTVTSNF